MFYRDSVMQIPTTLYSIQWTQDLEFSQLTSIKQRVYLFLMNPCQWNGVQGRTWGPLETSFPLVLHVLPLVG